MLVERADRDLRLGRDRRDADVGVALTRGQRGDGAQDPVALVGDDELARQPLDVARQPARTRSAVEERRRAARLGQRQWRRGEVRRRPGRELVARLDQAARLARAHAAFEGLQAPGRDDPQRRLRQPGGGREIRQRLGQQRTQARHEATPVGRARGARGEDIDEDQVRICRARRGLLGQRLQDGADRGRNIGGERVAAPRRGDRVARIAHDRVAGAQQQLQLAGVLRVEVARRHTRGRADVADARVLQPTFGDERYERVLDPLAMQPRAILGVQRGGAAGETLLGWERLGRHLHKTIRMRQCKRYVCWCDWRVSESAFTPSGCPEG